MQCTHRANTQNYDGNVTVNVVGQQRPPVCMCLESSGPIKKSKEENYELPPECRRLCATGITSLLRNPTTKTASVS
jgi:hypothetical protein